MRSSLSALGLAALMALPAAAQDFGPPELIAAAKDRKSVVYYTANFAEVEQEVIKAFNSAS
jgi:iron(III) transport system substrate-binding protein